MNRGQMGEPIEGAKGLHGRRNGRAALRRIRDIGGIFKESLAVCWRSRRLASRRDINSTYPVTILQEMSNAGLSDAAGRSGHQNNFCLIGHWRFASNGWRQPRACPIGV